MASRCACSELVSFLSRDKLTTYNLAVVLCASQPHGVESQRSRIFLVSDIISLLFPHSLCDPLVTRPPTRSCCFKDLVALLTRLLVLSAVHASVYWLTFDAVSWLLISTNKNRNANSRLVTAQE